MFRNNSEIVLLLLGHVPCISGLCYEEVYYGEMSVQLLWQMNSGAVNRLTGRAVEPRERMLMCCHVIGANHLKCASLLVALMRAT